MSFWPTLFCQTARRLASGCARKSTKRTYPAKCHGHFWRCRRQRNANNAGFAIRQIHKKTKPEKTAMARKSKKLATTYDIEFVKSAARGRWPEIISTIARIDAETLDGKHHPCPRCGGTDRFRMIDADAGALLCNQCFTSNNGDGFQAIQWANGIKFAEALQLVADHLGIEPTKAAANSTSNGKAKKPAPGHAKLIDAIYSYGQFLARKESISLEKSVLIYPYRIDVANAADANSENSTTEPTFHVVRYELKDNKGKRFCPFHFRQSDKKWYSGDPPGKLPLYELPCIKNEPHVYVCEGEKAVDAIRELHLPATTTAHGSKSAGRTDLTPLAGKRVTILRDNDDDGKHYAATMLNLLAALTPPATAVIKLLPDLPAKGDAHDFIAANRLFGLPDDEIIALIESTPIDEETMASAKATTGQPGQVTASGAIEHDDDPHRLARINLERYAATEGGATIRYWRDEWYTWKPSRGCYRRIGEKELRAKISAGIKAEFDRINIEKQSDPKEDDPVAKKVTRSLVTNVMEATASMALIPSSVEAMTWISGKNRQRRNYVAMKNGILDLDRLLDDENAEINDVLLPHSPEWFSCVRLPYEFDPEAQCPRWLNFIQHNMAGDTELMSILQEWAGYCLLPDTGMQKFLLMEGEGSNGKSVYMAAITAMLGEENVSNVPLEVFGDRFSRTETLGKLANVAGDCEELDKVAEGYIKSFTSGDRMYFDRKGISGIHCVPTARMMISCNERPRFRDRSNGVWRRMLLVPWRVVIEDSMKIHGMDKPWWWQDSGELPGILLWAIKGLHQLRINRGFSSSIASNLARSDYQKEMNSAKAFLSEYVRCVESDYKKSTYIRSDLLYEIYVKWARLGGYYPFAKPTFAKEVFREFKEVEKKQKREPSFSGINGDRHWVYQGIEFVNGKIADVSTEDSIALANES